MAVWNISAAGNQLVVALTPDGGDVAARNYTYIQPSQQYVNNVIKLFEAGKYVQTLTFEQIGTIAGDTPTDLADASAKIQAIVENFSGGGVAPTPESLISESDPWGDGSKNYLRLGSDDKLFVPITAEFQVEEDFAVVLSRYYSTIYIFTGAVDVDGTLPSPVAVSTGSFTIINFGTGTVTLSEDGISQSIVVNGVGVASVDILPGEVSRFVISPLTSKYFLY